MHKQVYKHLWGWAPITHNGLLVAFLMVTIVAVEVLGGSGAVCLGVTIYIYTKP